MSFRKDNDAYEAWLATQCDIVAEDLAYKHKRMKKNAFVFLRATYFRWARKIGDWCPELMDAPQVRSVGDLHLENFGTWRDADGRFVWGVNDFDEAAMMPYTLDLVRLATSVRLMPDLTLDNRLATDAILRGYGEGLANPLPALLNENAIDMRSRGVASDDDCRDFWKEVADYPAATPPAAVRSGLTKSLPDDASDIRFCSRRAGGGSLGRPRFVAIAQWCGGSVLREAKALVPSAWIWAHDTLGAPSQSMDLARGPYRAPDPFLTIRDGFVYRRIAVDSRKIELGDDPDVNVSMLHAMGVDLGAVHAAGTGPAAAILHDLGHRPEGWLHAEAKSAAASVTGDFEEWSG